MHQVWRLSEYYEGNLGLACTKGGLFLGRTPLIERYGTEIRYTQADRDRTPLEPRLWNRLCGGSALAHWALLAWKLETKSRFNYLSEQSAQG